MEIAELILLLQNEVQRSYDLVEESIRMNSSNPIYINIEKMEIDLPIILSKKEKKINVTELKKKSKAEQKFNLPFSMQTLHQNNKIEFIKALTGKQLVGSSIHIELVGDNVEKGNSVKAEHIGRIKLVLKPIMNS